MCNTNISLLHHYKSNLDIQLLFSYVLNLIIHNFNNSFRRKHQKLWEAVETNDIKAVETILNKLGDSNSLEDADLHDASGQSMVHKAASMGHAEILMLLLERTGIKPDLVNASLATPLHLACKNNRESVAKFLIGCGVDVNMQDEHG